MNVTIQSLPNLSGKESRPKVLKIHPDDNVVVALAGLKKGEEVSSDGRTFSLLSDIPAKHKFVLNSLESGDPITMYGILIGKAVGPIRQGDLITTRNVHHSTVAVQGKSATRDWMAPDVSRWQQRTFLGYHRADGQVGTRNYWLVIPLVFCENRNVAVLKQAFEEELGYAPPQIYRNQVAKLVELYKAGKASEIGAEESEHPGAAGSPRKIFSNVDGIKFLAHEGGCGGTRQDSSGLVGLLAGYIHHPNVAGATILSLGCQGAQVEFLRKAILARNPGFNKPLVVLEQQQSGSEFKMVSQAIRQTFQGLVEADKCRRQPASLSRLSVALQCGGSDGFSGISANPAVGHASDLVAALGGITILSEFPELCGVEQELVNRSTKTEIADRFLDLMRTYNARAEAVGSGFDMNPSPGNIRDGLITDAMKSAGAAKKGGAAPVTAVLDFPEYATEPGLNLLCTPGNDVESVTAQVGAGANVVLFTTGLGTPTGNPIAPVIKISSNSDLAQKMPDIIDLDAGAIIAGNKTVEESGEAILELASRVASGEIKTKAELLNQDDFIPWKRGVSL